MNVLERVIKPNRCAIAFGIPVTFKAYNESCKSAVKSDFASRFINFEEYKTKVINIYESTLKKIIVESASDLSVYHGVTLEKIADIFRGPYDVVILFTHWRGDKVELFDGLHASSIVAKSVPSNYDGFVDLCVCHPGRLPIAIKEQSPNCYVRYANATLTVRNWLLYFAILFKLLQEKELTYLDATIETVGLLVRDYKVEVEGDTL